MCAVPALYGCDGPWSYDYGHALHDISTPPADRVLGPVWFGHHAAISIHNRRTHEAGIDAAAIFCLFFVTAVSPSTLKTV